MFRYIIAPLIALPLMAQQQSRDTARVPSVVVSATRAPLAQSALPVAVTVITGEELRVRGITTVADALGDVTSASGARTGSAGATTSLFLRGGESKYVKVLIDGVPANEAGGAFDFASLTTDNVERIEVVRGPASVIHGADAVTGVVHVITRRGRGTQRVDVDVSTGMAPREMSSAASRKTMHTVDANATLTGGLASGSYAFGLARHTSSGLYELNNRYQNNVLSGRVLLSPSATTDVRLSLRYNDYQFNYPTSGSGEARDSNSYRIEDRTVVGVEVERRLARTSRVTLAVASSVNEGGTDDQMDAPGGSSFVSQDKTRRRGVELRYQAVPVSSAALTVGVHVEHQDQRSQSQSQSSFGPFTSVFRSARRNTGVYGEVVATPASSLTLTAGARLDDNQEFGTFRTGRAGVSWWPLSATRLRATFGNAFREPAFNENFNTAFTTGNPGLRPERTRAVDVGVDQRFMTDRVEVSATAFRQRFADMIDFSGSVGPCGFSYCNLVAARADGVEGEVRVDITPSLRATGAVTVLETRVLTAGVNDGCCGDLYQDGEPLVRRPEHKWTGQLFYQGAGPLTASVRLMLVGQRPDRDFRSFPFTPVIVPGYQRTDVSARYAIDGGPLRRTALTLRIENLTDSRYQEVFNFLAPRRTIAVGIQASM
jgi:vitamin B12 transporter